MTQQESKNLQKYFEDEPASFFDELAPKEGETEELDPKILFLHSKFFFRLAKSVRRSQRFVALSWERSAHSSPGFD